MLDIPLEQLHIPPRKPNENNRQFAFRVLYDNIMSLALAPGRQLSDGEIAALLHISRTPVREAFVHLTESRLMEVYPQRSSCVSHINLDYVEEGIFLRHAVEGKILRAAMREIASADILVLRENLRRQKECLDTGHWYDYVLLDNEFHRIIYHISRKPWTWNVVNNISTHLNRVRLLQIQVGGETLKTSYIDHCKLFDMIVAREIPDIDDFLYEHITACYRAVLPVLLEQYPSYFALPK
ncbi:GntR family transcriptional regulator [Christensenellaceae bacterium OttesenSCG-928-L17]|nr:GntR family transcriptional regulator [Christensenellaceae bacterium OttesenSCG-928-L17]